MKILILTLLLVVSGIAQANLLVVDSTDDVIQVDNNCTLREAITAANFDINVDQCGAGLGDDLIWVLFGTNGASIQLTNQLGIIDGVEIQGPGADQLVLIPANNYDGHIFQINTDRDVKIQDMRIGGARSSAVDVVNVRDLTIEDMRFLNNTADSSNNYGGAIHADVQDGTSESLNSLLIKNTLFQSNTAANGGAVAAGGSYEFVVENSQFISNAASSSGAAIYRYYRLFDDVDDIFTRITNSQFIGNDGSSGATVAVLQQTLDINESLFQNNSGSGSVVALNSRGSIENSMFTSRSSGAAILLNGVPGTLASVVGINFNTFINESSAIDVNVGNLAEATIRGNAFAGTNLVSCFEANNFTLVSNGYNLEAAGSTCTNNNADLPNIDAQLMPLGLYGGDILYAPPNPLSPLVDAGVGCNNNDISGQGRSRDGDANGQARCDIGAVERPNAHNLTAGFVGNGLGEIHLSDFDLTCHTADNNCTWPLPQNETFAFTATPEAGSTFIQWGLACSGDTTCDITMDNFKFLNAEFASLSTPVTLTVAKFLDQPGLSATVVSSPAGIVCGPNCSADFLENDVVELTATVDSGTVIDTWSGCDVITNNGETCKLSMGTQNTTVNLFLQQDPDIIFKSGFEQ